MGTVKRLILAEPGLIRAVGHEQAHARVLVAECAKRGVALQVLVNSDAEDGVVSEFEARRTFGISVYAKAEPAGTFDILKIRRTWSRRYGDDFHCALDPLDVDQHDLLLLNTVTISVLDGYLLWLRGRSPKQRPATAIIFRLGAEEGLPGRRYPRLSRWFYRQSILNLRQRLDGRLLLATDAKAIGKDFARLARLPVADIPLPIAVPAATPPVPSQSVSIVFPSTAYAHKGFALLPDALRLAIQRRSDLRAIIRVADAPKSAAPAIDQLQAMAPQVRLVHGALSEERFYQILTDADGVVLPYDPDVFAKRSSQILAQAAALGRPVVVIAGSFLDDECRSAGISAVTAEAYTAAALGGALVRFAMEREKLAKAAWAAGPIHRERHSASAFVDRLLSFGRSCEVVE